MIRYLLDADTEESREPPLILLLPLESPDFPDLGDFGDLVLERPLE
jgi:hypothetical protein